MFTVNNVPDLVLITFFCLFPRKPSFEDFKINAELNLNKSVVYPNVISEITFFKFTKSLHFKFMFSMYIYTLMGKRYIATLSGWCDLWDRLQVVDFQLNLYWRREMGKVMDQWTAIKITFYNQLQRSYFTLCLLDWVSHVILSWTVLQYGPGLVFWNLFCRKHLVKKINVYSFWKPLIFYVKSSSSISFCLVNTND